MFSSEAHTIGDGPVSDRAPTLAWLERRRRLHEESGLAWYGLWERGESFVGTCGVFLGGCGEEPETGYEIAAPKRGHGYAAEAAGVVTGACHAAGHTSVWATVRPANVASVRTVGAVGYAFIRSDVDDKGPLDFYRHAGRDTK